MGPGGVGRGNPGEELKPFQMSVEERATRLERRQTSPAFVTAAFKAYLQRAQLKAGGDLEITFGVPAAEKWEAFKVSDAAGVVLHIEVSRVFKEVRDDG